MEIDSGYVAVGMKRSRSVSEFDLSNNKKRLPSDYAPHHRVPMKEANSHQSNEWAGLDTLQLATPPVGASDLYSIPHDSMDLGIMQQAPYDHRTETLSDFSHRLNSQLESQSLPTSPYPHQIIAADTYFAPQDMSNTAPHYAPHLGSNLAGSPRDFDSPRFPSNSSLYGSASPELQMRMTPPPEATYGRSDAYPTSAFQHYPPPRQPPLPVRAHQPKPGYKLTMGYRADCEKCLAHVPGHYQHLERIAVPDVGVSAMMTY